MPVYEYECTECGEVEEALQKISEPQLKECPRCKGRLKKLISQSTFHLKGSGWYVTDYGGSSNQAAPAGSGTTETDSSKGDGASRANDKASAPTPKSADDSEK
ncbi:MAG: zinc ribbon domain-containing protein [Desulfarculaceae bacterium]|nr:zinc ribbon domain-containing protein [Desulfarculaceae bacterium]